MTKLFIVEGDQTMVVENAFFENEKLLQDVLERFPEFIALEDLGVAEPFIVIGREVSTPAGYIDVLCIDGDGVLTVIETKLARNPEIRREVIGQVLEYVAQLSKWRAQEVINAANKYLRSKSSQANQDNNLLYELICNFDQTNVLGLESLYDLIDSNLRKGRIKIVIASDSIPDNLKDTITFINSSSNFDIYVLQLQAFNKDNLQIYAPAIYGYTSKVNTGVQAERIQWNEEMFFKLLENCDIDLRDAIKRLYDFCKEQNTEIKWGTGKVSGSFSMLIEREGLKATVYSLYYNERSSYISVNFGTLKRLFSIEVLEQFRLNLNRLKGVSLPEQAITDGKYPTIRVDLLVQDDNLTSFNSAVKTLLSK